METAGFGASTKPMKSNRTNINSKLPAGTPNTAGTDTVTITTTTATAAAATATTTTTTNTNDANAVVPPVNYAFNSEKNNMDALVAYSEKYSIASREPLLLQKLRIETEQRFPPNVARMLSSSTQGALLSFLASMTRAQHVLELGSFVGYSTLSLALDYGLDYPLLSTGEQQQQQPQQPLMSSATRQVWSCELDKDAYNIAQHYIQQAGESIAQVIILITIYDHYDLL
jgi:hypothetical protein